MATSNINRWIGTGNLTADPDLRSLSSGTAVCKLRLAVNTRRKDNTSGEYVDKPNYFDITVWGAQGEACARYLAKGSPVAIDGHLQWREWQTDDNTKRQAVEIVADTIQFLGRRPNDADNGRSSPSRQRSAPSTKTSLTSALADPTSSAPAPGRGAARRHRRHGAQATSARIDVDERAPERVQAPRLPHTAVRRATFASRPGRPSRGVVHGAPGCGPAPPQRLARLTACIGGGDRSRTRRGHEPHKGGPTVSTPTMARRAQEIALDRIDVGGNVRELDAEHVAALAGSMAVRGLIVPVAVRPLEGERFALVAGEHRLAAARELGWSTIAAVISEQAEGTSGDQGAENVLRKTLTPLEEARAVEKMLADGYTVDGAATVLGWHKRRVTARQRILELPETAQTLVGSGEIPVGGIDALLEIQAVSPKLVALVAEVIAEAAAEGNALGAQLARDPGWLVRQVLSHRPGALFAALAGGTLYEDQIAELKLGKKTTALYAEAKTLHGQLDRYAYGPPPVRIGEAEIDQARAAGVLLELDRTQVILDRGVYRELVKAAVARTVEELRARAQERASEQRERKSAARQA